MPSNNSKYSEELRTQRAEHILRSGKSATSVAEELGIDTNTVCRWVRDYRRAKIDTELAEHALSNALARNSDVYGLIFHSDRGC